MRWARSEDRTVYVTIGPSGGRANFEAADRSAAHETDVDQQDRRNVVQLVSDALLDHRAAQVAMVSDLGRWLVRWVVFRGGWTVYIDAPDRDPIKVRCPNEATARERVDQIVALIETNGVDVVDELSR